MELDGEVARLVCSVLVCGIHSLIWSVIRFLSPSGALLFGMDITVLSIVCVGGVRLCAGRLLGADDLPPTLQITRFRLCDGDVDLVEELVRFEFFLFNDLLLFSASYFGLVFA